MSRHCTPSCTCWGHIVHWCRRARSRSYDFRTFLGAGSAASRIRRSSRLWERNTSSCPTRTHRPRPGDWRTTRPLRCREWRCGGIRGHFLRAWIVHDVRVWPPFSSTDPQTIRRHIEELLLPAAQPRDLRHTAVVECDVAFVAARTTAAVGQAARESVYVTAARGRRVELEVALSARDWSS